MAISVYYSYLTYNAVDQAAHTQSISFIGGWTGNSAPDYVYRKKGVLDGVGAGWQTIGSYAYSSVTGVSNSAVSCDANHTVYMTIDFDPTGFVRSNPAPFGVVNYWGGEPGRTSVAARLAQNPHHPRFFVNGPLTGVAVIGAGGDEERVARGLALNMILYEQQLCSSPTIGVYVGGYEEALHFALKVHSHLEAIGSQYPIESSNDALFVTNSARQVLVLKGSKVLNSERTENPWTLAISKKSSNLDSVVSSFPSFNVHGRRRFLELVVGRIARTDIPFSGG